MSRTYAATSVADGSDGSIILVLENPSTDAGALGFWRERHLCFLATPREGRGPHLVPVGATLDLEAGLVRVITSRHSHKVTLIRRAGPDALVAVGQVDGRRWCTLEGRAVVKDDPDSVAEAERRYAERYRQPRPNPDRVVIEVTIARALGNERPPGW